MLSLGYMVITINFLAPVALPCYFRQLPKAVNVNLRSK